VEGGKGGGHSKLRTWPSFARKKLVFLENELLISNYFVLTKISQEVYL